MMSSDIQSLAGSLVALVTPMDDKGGLDFDALNSLIEWHIEQGSDGLVVTGTTGESATLNHEEHAEIIARAVHTVGGRLPVIAGVGSNSTAEAIALSHRAHQSGVTACLQVTPYYNCPPQEGLYRHFAEIARQVSTRHILYNVPARTGVDMLPDTVARLAKIDNIIGIKEATGDLARAEKIQSILQPLRPDFRLYAGDDKTGLDLMSIGATGIISVTANITPALSHRLCQLVTEGQIPAAREIDARLVDLHRHLFIQSNPIPVKWALQQTGMISGGIRLPLISLQERHHPLVRRAMERAGVS